MNTTTLSDQEFLKTKPVDDSNLKKEKLTAWKKEPELKELKHDFTQAKSSQSAFIANKNKWLELYNAPKFGNSKTKGSRVVPKLVRKQAEWRCPALSEPFLSTNQLFKVNALTHEDVPRAKQNALILNMQFNTQLNKVTLVDEIIRSVVKYGTTIVRLGWDYQEEQVTENVMQYSYQPAPMEMAEQLQQQYQQLAQLQQTEPDTYETTVDDTMKAGFEMSQEKQTLLIANPVGEKQEKVTKPSVNKPIIEVCDLDNVYIDPTCKGKLDKAQFIIHSYESSLSDLKKQGTYQNLDYLKDYTQTGSLEHSNGSETDGFVFADKARKKLVVYEYWGYWDIDGNGKTKAIVASWVGDVLIRMEENPFPDAKLPFVIFNYLPEENTPYGIPDAELIEDNQVISGAVTRGIIDLLGKNANSQTGYAKHFLDATNKIRFRKGDDYEYNPQSDPRLSMHTHTYPEIPNSAMTVIQMMNNEAESLSGVKAFSGTGINASHLGDSATAARGVLDAVSKREMSILRRIAKGFIEIGRKLIAMNAQWLSDEEVVRVTNAKFVTVRREDLAGNFDLTLGISTAEEDNAKAQELAFMLQTMGNNMGMEINQLILSEIATLRKMPDLADKILKYKPEPDEMAQQLQQLEMEKLKAEIELLKAEAMETGAKAQVQGAKVNVEQARAESLQGDADNKALDFMEKDTGIKHERDLQKQDVINEGIINQQQLKNEGLSQQVADNHNANLLQQYANSNLSTL